ncbi:winged helix-turn-helix domain-containing protein [Micromonospora soli]|uniref:winged helix-turn-helix domain-containing protein n=1 Tax=Micromonospora sp. NBRC 110009 TaxID=3061627 RepID=UPI002671FE10|nr:winged helix-turn-helix domain-containing protein [Micromonospora sp. NBRC 110009]WKT97736.1 winged helix-turn-helix domain-containing protein [Micromonospora sp. NBRC 110009]
MAEDDENTGGSDPTEGPFPLLIAVTPSPADRIRLAELLDGVAPLLVVADLDELRRLIAPPRPPADVSATPPSEATHPPDSTPPPDDTLLIDSAKSTARCRDREVPLTRLEHDLLVCLTTEPARVWSYTELHRSVWRDEGLHRKADVQSLVKRLRRKLDELGTGVTIVAVRGVGFRLTDHQQPRAHGAGRLPDTGDALRKASGHAWPVTPVAGRPPRPRQDRRGRPGR